jgi:hypothetical protein
MVVDDIKPHDISLNYSIELLSLISSTLSSEHNVRPTATQVKDQLSVIALQLFQPKKTRCRACGQAFSDHPALPQRHKETGHRRKFVAKETYLVHEQEIYKYGPGLTIHSIADAPAKYHYDDTKLDAIDTHVWCATHTSTLRDSSLDIYMASITTKG